MVPKWKMLRMSWNLTKLPFQICWSQVWCQKWFLLNIYHLLGPNWCKIKNAQNLLEFSLYWYFEYNDFYFKVKKKCCEIFVVCLAQISSKNKNTQNVLKIGLLNISNMPISILNSKKKKIKYLPPVTPKLVSKLKIIKNLLKFSTLDISNILILILMSKIIFIKYFYQISVFIKFQ